jgi:hypothetical protein
MQKGVVSNLLDKAATSAREMNPQVQSRGSTNMPCRPRCHR